MYVERNPEERSCNHCFNVTAINITRPECVFVALRIEQHAMGIRHIFARDLSRSTTFLHIISQMVRFKKKKTPKKILNIKCVF